MKRQRHDTPETSRAFFYLVSIAAIIMLTLCAKQAKAAAQWLITPNIYVDHTNSPLLNQEYEDVVKFALWEWSERTGKNFVLAGTKSGTAQIGEIINRWGNIENMGTLPGKTDWAVFTDSGSMAYATTYYNDGYYYGTVTDSLRHTIAHEIGHAIGIVGKHSPSPSDVMYYAAHNRYNLTTSDILMADYVVVACFAVLNPDNSIYIPDIEGQSALLSYNGDFTWSLSDLRDNVATQGCTQASVSESLVVTINDLRGIDSSYTDVRLVPVGSDTWALDFAR